LIRDWLDRQYGRPASAPRRIRSPAASKRVLSLPSPLLARKAGEKVSRLGWKAAAAGVVVLLVVWASLARNAISRSVSQYLGGEKQIEETRRAERERAARQQNEADPVRRRQDPSRQKK